MSEQCQGQCGCGHGASAGTDTVRRHAIGAVETVEDVVRRTPEAADVLRRFGIDTCCGGRLTLAQAAAAAGIPVATLLTALDAGEPGSQ
jgi:uncharacterized protein DUF542